MGRDIVANWRQLVNGECLWPPFLWRARWFRSRGRIRHLLVIICEYIAEMSREHVSLFDPSRQAVVTVSLSHYHGVLTRSFKSSQPPSRGQLRTRRKSDSGSSAPRTPPIDLRGIGSM